MMTAMSKMSPTNRSARRSRGPPSSRGRRILQSGGLTHVDAEGKARMVDVGGKARTERRARAHAVVVMAASTLRRLKEGRIEKGAVLAAARIAGIQAAKKTPELIPLCHSLALSSVTVDFAIQGARSLEILAEARTVDRTGVEMEALTAAAVAALTVYDMLKAIEKGIVVTELALLEKDGGKSGPWRRPRSTRSMGRKR
jgi:cyclic pyranopterin phosphate synthase